MPSRGWSVLCKEARSGFTTVVDYFQLLRFPNFRMLEPLPPDPAPHKSAGFYELAPAVQGCCLRRASLHGPAADQSPLECLGGAVSA